MESSVADYFNSLGAAASREWTRLGRDFNSLSEAAVLALTEMPPDQCVGAIALLQDAARRSDLPAVQSALSDDFGQPPLVVFAAEDFFIQALTWIDGTTDVHQHGFDGAFALAEGLSLHVPYSFDLVDSLLEGRLVAGDLSMRQPEILRPGDVRAIRSGFGFIHCLFHLERPTLTIVIRNRSSNHGFPQYSYLRPGIGYDALWSDRRFAKRLQALGALRRLDRAAADAATAEVISAAPTWEAFLALQETIRSNGWNARADDLSCILAQRLGTAGDLLMSALRAEVLQRNVLSRRALFTEPRQRLFLALLANLPDRQSVQHAVGELFPGGDVPRLILEWIFELASEQNRTISGLRLSHQDRNAIRTCLDQTDPVAEDDLQRVLSSLLAHWKSPALLKGLLSP